MKASVDRAAICRAIIDLDNRASANAIADALGASSGSVRELLAEMQEEGLVAYYTEQDRRTKQILYLNEITDKGKELLS